MNGNGTADETPVEVTPAQAPPPWMHDFLPASCIYDCQGPECDQSARAYWQNNIGFVAPGWQAMDQRPFCSWLCVARYAAIKAEGEIADSFLSEPPAVAPLGTRKRSRHN